MIKGYGIKNSTRLIQFTCSCRFKFGSENDYFIAGIMIYTHSLICLCYRMSSIVIILVVKMIWKKALQIQCFQFHKQKFDVQRTYLLHVTCLWVKGNHFHSFTAFLHAIDMLPFGVIFKNMDNKNICNYEKMLPLWKWTWNLPCSITICRYFSILSWCKATKTNIACSSVPRPLSYAAYFVKSTSK